MSIHQRHLLFLVTEIFKSISQINPEFILHGIIFLLKLNPAIQFSNLKPTLKIWEILIVHLMLLSVRVIFAKTSWRNRFPKWTNFQRRNLLSFVSSVIMRELLLLLLFTQLLLQSDHFINPSVWYLFFGLNFITSILVMISFHKGMVVSVPWYIDKHQTLGHFFRKEQIFK